MIGNVQFLRYYPALSVSENTPDSARSPETLLDRLGTCSALAEKLEALSASEVAGEKLVFPQVAPAGQCCFAASVVRSWQRARGGNVAWLLCAHTKAQELVQGELTLWGLEGVFLPERAWAGMEDALPDPEEEAERLAALKAIHEGRAGADSADPAGASPLVVVATAESLEQKAPRPGSLNRQARVIAEGDALDLEQLGRDLEEAGYDRESQVFRRGQFAVRGGIVDVFSWQAARPVRVELFGDEVESVREFDLDTQVSVEASGCCELLLAEANLEQSGRVSDYIGEGDLVVALDCDYPGGWSNCPALAGASILEGGGQGDSRGQSRAPSGTVARGAAGVGPSTRNDHEASGSLGSTMEGHGPPGPEACAGEDEMFAGACYDHPLGSFEAGDFILREQRRGDFAEQMASWKHQGWMVAMAFQSEGEWERFSELVDGEGSDDDAGSKNPRERQASAGSRATGRKSGKAREGIASFLLPLRGNLSRGFTVPGAKLAVLSDAEIFGRYQHLQGRRRTKLSQRRLPSQQVSSLREFDYGDLVVHVDYGIGKFRGIVEKEKNGVADEVLEIEYADEARLYVPIDQAHLVSRYLGTGKKAPKLSRLGDKRWARTRRDAENAIEDYAAQLLAVQAERDSLEGFACEPDGRWQWEFENSFLHKETPDQVRAIAETKEDMESPRPMDRLVCGDVGFGKTEVAIRAAFKAVMSGKQVAVLAPTTVLADQHYHTFRERMSDFPVRIDLLSRYRSAGQQRKTMADLAAGRVDIVVGTHRILSKDIVFRDLGLAVVDEEQRFGVADKERFKEKWRFVDVLTLSATPIPRTLYLSLMGAREMSTIDTPPPNRRPVATAVCPHDERTIRSAIQRELARQGQVFYLHNRVKSIHGVKRRLEDLVPGARVGVGHGQMPDEELEEVMGRFVRHEFDVLVCTTIIESGVDIPNANTIIIDRADRFGLADLYQIRGRVGRADRRAYAFLMLPPDLLAVGDAQKRIRAIKQYSSLGAGFQIAMRDLEIRGAGNLLGRQQSGHIAAIGFDLYCQLLKQSVARLKGEKVAPRADIPFAIDFLRTNEAEHLHSPGGGLAAYVPSDYMPDSALRITAYREVAEASAPEELEDLRERWRDRFGRLPAPAENLLLCAEIKVRAAHKGCTALEIKDGKLMFARGGKYVQIKGKFPRLIGDNEDELLESALDWVLDL